jgi:hypothetical protein
MSRATVKHHSLTRLTNGPHLTPIIPNVSTELLGLHNSNDLLRSFFKPASIIY